MQGLLHLQSIQKVQYNKERLSGTVARVHVLL
jgi:hypothetical protein